MHLRFRRATFCGPQFAGHKKRIGTAPGFSPAPTLSLSSLARVSSTLQLGGHPVVERFARHRSSVQVWAPLPCGSGGGTLRPLQPRPGLPGLPLVRPLSSGFPLRLAPSRSTLRLGWPKGPHRRSAMAGSSACASEPITLRPAVAGTPSACVSADLAPWGYFVAQLVGSYDEAPEASADEALQLPIGLPLLPGNFRTVRFPEAASLDLAPRGFRLLAPPPGKPSANGSHSPAGTPCRQGRLGLRLGVPGSKWLLPPSPAFES